MTREEIKAAITMQEILERYGIRPNRSGFIVCPFHNDKNPSMKIYKDGYKCFACGAYGDIFEFIMKYEGVPFSAAFTALGGTYPKSIDKKGKTRKQIRREMRDAKSGECHHGSINDGELEEIKKNISLYEAGLAMLEAGSEFWYECQLNLEKEKSRYEYLLSKKEGEGDS